MDERELHAIRCRARLNVEEHLDFAGVAAEDVPALLAEIERLTGELDEVDRLAAAVERVREYVRVDDPEDVTDWQRGYRAASNRALAAVNADREGNVPEPVGPSLREQVATLTADRDRLRAAYRDLAERTEREHRRLEAERNALRVERNALARMLDVACKPDDHLDPAETDIEAALGAALANRDRYRAVVERVRILADDLAGGSDRRSLIADQLRSALSAAEPFGVDAGTGEAVPAVLDAAHLAHQREWSCRTFGPGRRTGGVLDHIRKELIEIEADPTDLGEWVDVIILAFDGAWRAGWEPQETIDAIKAKQRRNEGRHWPDWRTASEDAAIEHDRTGEVTP